MTPEIRLREKLSRASNLVETGQHAEAIPLLEAIRKEAQSYHLSTAFVNFQLAIAADMTGNLRLAVQAIVAAQSEDPTNPGIQSSLNIIGRRVYEALSTCEDDAVPELVSFLEHLGEVPVQARVRQADWLLRRGEVQAAARVIFAAHVIEPRSQAVIEMAERLMAALGGNWLSEMDARLGFAGLDSKLSVASTAKVSN